MINTIKYRKFREIYDWFKISDFNWKRKLCSLNFVKDYNKTYFMESDVVLLI